MLELRGCATVTAKDALALRQARGLRHGRSPSLREISLAGCRQLTAAELRGLATLPVDDVDLHGTLVAEHDVRAIAQGWSTTCRVRLGNGSWLTPR